MAMGNARINADSSFLDSRWLLYTQPLMSEENTAHMDGDLTFCLERVKIIKNGML